MFEVGENIFKIGAIIIYFLPGGYLCWAINYWPKKISWVETVVVSLSLSVILQAATAFAVSALYGSITRQILIFSMLFCDFIVFGLGSIIKIRNLTKK
jgi:uncharacterized membrane protein